MTGSLIAHVLPYFPGSVQGSDGVTISQAATVWTVGLGAITPDGINIGSAPATFLVSFTTPDSASNQYFFGGNSKGVRIWTSSSGSNIDGVDSTGNISFQPLEINASALSFGISAVVQATLDANNLTAVGGIKSTSASGGIGYATGAGGTVTQNTSKSTGVTLNKVTGQITMNNAALAANTTVSFTLTNSAVAAADTFIFNHISGGTIGAYTFNAAPAGGSATISVRNVSDGSLSEAVVFQFTIIKAVTA